MSDNRRATTRRAPGAQVAAQQAEHTRGTRSEGGLSPRLLVGIVVAVLLAVLAGGAVVVRGLPTTYTTSSILALRPRADADLSADTLSMIAHEYSVFMGSEGIADLGRQKAGVPFDDPGTKVSASQDPQTSTIRVTVTAARPETAITVSNTILQQAVARGSKDTHVEPTTVEQASTRSVLIGPPRSLYLAGLVSGVALCAAAALYVLRGRRDDSARRR